MGLAIFEKYSQTKEGTDYAPFIVGAPIAMCFDLVSKWVKENKYEEVEENKDYWEIFGKKDEKYNKKGDGNSEKGRCRCF